MMACAPCSPERSHIVLGGYDGSLAGLSLEADDTSALTLALKFAYSPHVNAVRSLALKCSLLASGGVDETIRIYDLAKAVEVGSVQHHDGTINALQFVRDSKRTVLFSCSDDASICVWRCSDWSCLKQLRGHNSPVVDMAVHKSARVALSVSKDRSLCMWNLAKGKVAFSCKTKGSVPKSVLWAPSGEKYSLTSGRQLTLFSVDGKSTSVFDHTHPVLCEQFIDNTTIATGGEEKVVRVWDSRQPSDSAIAFEHEKRVRSLAYLDGLLVSADSGGALKIWDARMKGQPRIETAIADGHLRLTCMTAGAQKELDTSDRDESENDENDATKSAKRNKQQRLESSTARVESASQRKRKKRKLLKQMHK
ncbi:WD40/YVTN repeat-like containing protein [Gracilaria domingensis]|nr:WD40/YVTN repeat-like containing protein [Gracilaria domingensis]